MGRPKIAKEVDDSTVRAALGVTPAIAHYWETGVPAYDRNPLIQALGPLRTMSSLAAKISVPGDYRPELRQANNAVRFSQIGLLSRAFWPTTTQCAVGREFYETLRNGYVHRDIPSVKSVKAKQDAYRDQDTDDELPAPDRSPIVAGATLIGVSGMGKTRLMSRVLDTVPQVIFHPEYMTTQLVYIRVEAAQNSSAKAFVLSVHAAIDRALGEHETTRLERGTHYAALEKLCDRISRSHIGIIVVDEIQNAAKKSTSATDNWLGFLVNFVNVVKIPVYLMGTIATLDSFAKSFKMGRRALGEVVMNFESEKDEEFINFMKELYRHQYTSKFSSLTEKIIKAFYQRTQGILALMVLLFQYCQKMAIDTGVEEIDEKMVNEVADDIFKVIQNAIDALQTKNITRITEFEDLFSEHVRNLRESWPV